MCKECEHNNRDNLASAGVWVGCICLWACRLYLMSEHVLQELSRGAFLSSLDRPNDLQQALE